jgi:hypothetical protein
MAGRSKRGRWQPLAIGCGLVLAITSLAGATTASHDARPPRDVRPPSLRTLQLNLCDSGIARCYTGRSVGVAVDVIRAERPDIVTLNEICRGDVSVLERAMSGANRNGIVSSAFEAAEDRRTGGAVRCRNGQQYGIGLLARVRSPTEDDRTFADVYPMQDAGDPEERVWLCLHAIAGFYACTTHLASKSAIVALTQCRYLLDTAIPTVRSEGGRDPVVLGADLNLISGDSPDAKSCLPAGYRSADDGSRQHIVASPDLAVRSSRSISMRGTTDHPGLLVELVTSSSGALGWRRCSSRARRGW